MSNFGSSIVYGLLRVTRLIKAKAMEIEESLTVGGNNVLTTADEGSGKGIDADTVDGEHASAFANTSHSHGYLPLSGGTVTGSLTINNTLEVVGNRIGFINTNFDAEIRVDDGNPNGTGASFNFYGDGISRNATLSAEYFDGKAADSDKLDGYHLSNRTNWYTNNGDDIVVGQLAWRNYNNNHTIFDASAGTTPTGATCDKTNPNTSWRASYPTLMGYNGSSTYGVRVDRARYSDSAADSDKIDGHHLTVGTTAPSSPSTNDIWIDTSG